MQIQHPMHRSQRILLASAVAIPLLAISVDGIMIFHVFTRIINYFNILFTPFTYLTLLLLLISGVWALITRAALLGGNLKIKVALTILLFLITIPATKVTSPNHTSGNGENMGNDVRIGTPVPFLLGGYDPYMRHAEWWIFPPRDQDLGEPYPVMVAIFYLLPAFLTAVLDLLSWWLIVCCLLDLREELFVRPLHRQVSHRHSGSRH